DPLMRELARAMSTAHDVGAPAAHGGNNANGGTAATAAAAAGMGADGFVLCSALPLGADGTVAGVALARRDNGKGGQPFSPQDRLIVHLFHTEMGWVYDEDLPLAAPEVLS